MSRACSMRQGRRPVKTKKKSRPWTIGACLSLSGSSIYLPRFIKIGENLMNFCQEQNAQFFLRHGVLVELSVVFILLPFGE